MDTVVQVNDLSKKYTIRHEGEPSNSLREAIMSSVKSVGRMIANPGRKAGKGRAPSKEEFWALRDVSFELKEGDRLGIIGRNGAGKSTLLKILSRITEPTAGSIRIKGRVASLLEVGTGFHHELTGRENIYLNGAILGMSRDEIDRKFDEIVAFAEVERFLDTPVKRYSSGMAVRLAFAVAAHLEPEILIIDEVLAVGDAQFQKRCLGKMKEVGQQGRTVLFVSHNMGAVEQLCTRCMLLQAGKVRMQGEDVKGIINEYLFDQEKDAKSSDWVNRGDYDDIPFIRPERYYFSDGEGNRLIMPVSNNADIWVNIEVEIKDTDPALLIGYAIYAEDGTLLYWSYHTDGDEKSWPRLEKGRCKLRSKIPSRFLNEGMYRVELISSIHFRQWLCEPGNNAPAIYLNIQGGLSDSPYWMMKRPGLFAPVMKWEKV